MLKGIIFDVYGTLLMRQKTMRQWPCHVDSAYCMTNDIDIHKWRTLTGLPLSESEAHNLSSIIEEDLKSVVPFPDVIPTLLELRRMNIRIAIGSNLAKPYSQPINELLCNYIDEWGLSYKMSILKPQPEFFLTICERMKLQPGEVLMVGDTYSADILGGIGAGITSVLIDRNLNQVINAVDYKKIGTLFDLLSIIDTY